MGSQRQGAMDAPPHNKSKRLSRQETCGSQLLTHAVFNCAKMFLVLPVQI